MPTRDPRYHKTFLDKHGDDGIVMMRALPWAMASGGVIGGIVGARVAGIVGGLAGFAGGTFVIFSITRFVVRSGADLALRTLQPDGSTTPYQHDFSQIEAFVVRGELEAAAVLWEEAVAERPRDVEVRVRAGDFFAGAIGRPERAMALFREVQQLAAPPERHLYVAQRIVDLYVGPLSDKGKAVVELRKIVDRWPNSTAARFGREAIARIKAEMQGE
jgi:hypothetical protein